MCIATMVVVSSWVTDWYYRFVAKGGKLAISKTKITRDRNPNRLEFQNFSHTQQDGFTDVWEVGNIAAFQRT
jgi:hypothetical protein